MSATYKFNVLNSSMRVCASSLTGGTGVAVSVGTGPVGTDDSVALRDSCVGRHSISKNVKGFVLVIVVVGVGG